MWHQINNLLKQLRCLEVQIWGCKSEIQRLLWSVGRGSQCQRLGDHEGPEVSEGWSGEIPWPYSMLVLWWLWSIISCHGFSNAVIRGLQEAGSEAPPWLEFEQAWVLGRELQIWVPEDKGQGYKLNYSNKSCFFETNINYISLYTEYRIPLRIYIY